MPIEVTASPNCLNKIPPILFPIFLLSILPFMASEINLLTSISKSSFLYLLASSIKLEIPTESDCPFSISSVETAFSFSAFTL